MPQPIPSYLLAFAVGTSPGATSARARACTRSRALDAAAWELESVESHAHPRGGLFGLMDGSIRSLDHAAVLPLRRDGEYAAHPSSRRPCSPAIRSLVTWWPPSSRTPGRATSSPTRASNDFWLNRRLTVYAERRILEALEGKSARTARSAGAQALEIDLEAPTAKDPKLTRPPDS